MRKRLPDLSRVLQSRTHICRDSPLLSPRKDSESHQDDLRPRPARRGHGGGYATSPLTSPRPPRLPRPLRFPQSLPRERRLLFLCLVTSLRMCHGV